MKEWNRPCQLPAADEIGPITTHLIVDSPEYLSKKKIRGVKRAGEDKIEKGALREARITGRERRESLTLPNQLSHLSWTIERSALLWRQLLM